MPSPRLPADKLDPAALSRLPRDHWQNKNCLFHVRDVTFKADASRVHSAPAPRVMAELRNATLSCNSPRRSNLVAMR